MRVSDRLKSQIRSMTQTMLAQQRTIKELERRMTRIGDDLLAAGNTADAFREYYPGYLSPEERTLSERASRAPQAVA